MAHLLMIESWMLSSGMLLPQAIEALGHRYTLLCSEPERYRQFALTGGAHPVVALAEGVEACDTDCDQALWAAACRIYSSDPVEGVITSCDYYLRQVAWLAEQMGLPGASSAAITVANNKRMMRETMHRAGLAGPKFAVAQCLDEVIIAGRRMGYPLIVKPTDLCGSLLVRRVNDERELLSAAGAIFDCSNNVRGQPRETLILLEEELSGPEYSVETATIAGRTHFLGITDKSVCGAPYFVESGHMFPAQLSSEMQKAIFGCAHDALIAVGYDHGIAHTEIKWTEHGPRIVEINTRIGGNWISELMRYVLGVNPLEMAVQLALGENIQPPAPTTFPGSAAIMFLTAARAGVLEGIDGWERARTHPSVVNALLRPALSGRHVAPPTSNDDYLGYLMCVDEQGARARSLAESLLGEVSLRYSTSVPQCKSSEMST